MQSGLTMKKDHSKPGTEKYIKWKKLVQNFIVDSYEKSSIRRFKYMSSRKRAAKIIWLLMIICSIAVCTYQIYTLYSKWQSNPVIVTFDTDATSIWQIPFPAVTICPQSKSNHSKFKLAQLLNKIKYSSKERKSLYALAHVCIRRHPLFSFKNLGTPIKNQDVIKDLINIALDPMEIFKNIQIMDFFEDRKHFYEMFTNEGICFSYNLLDYKLLFNDIIDDSQQMPKHRGRFKKFTNWSLEGGYQGFSRHSYPFRALASGIKGGLSFDLKSLVADIDLICGNTVDGYKLALHTPGEFPRFEKHYIQIPFGQYVMLSVMPRVITTSEKLRNYSPHKRQCFFDGEKPLKFFKMYTQSNCELECETEYTNSVCGCVKFSMPHSNDTKVCDSKAGIKCTNEALSFFKIQNIVNILKKEEQNLNGNFVVDNFEDLEIDTFSINDSRTERQCDCLPACTSLQYDAEISQTLLNIDIMSKNGLENDSLLSSINIYFKEDQFFAMERHELYGWVQFIANCGGLLGLFMGFSIVSIIEIVYYILLFKSKKDDKKVNFKDPDKSSSVDKNSKFINVNSISDDWKIMPEFEYLP